MGVIIITNMTINPAHSTQCLRLHAVMQHKHEMSDKMR